jgi:hypothetical protein
MIVTAATCVLLPVVVGCLDQNKTKQSDSLTTYSTALVEENFVLNELGDAWEPRTPELWQIVAETQDRHVLTMLPPPQRPMPPGVQRPQEYVIYTRHRFRSFNLSCRVRVDGDPTVAGRNACILFGRQGEAHYYYVHLSNVNEEFSNCLVRVDGDTRTKLAQPDKAPMTDRDWHKVDITRDVDTGDIIIHVDAYDEDARPWLKARDTTYAAGHLGLGSFNDQASFARVLIEGQID